MQNPYFKFSSEPEYTKEAGWTPTAKDGYTYSLEYWETLHQLDLLSTKNHGWIPGTEYTPEALAELAQYNQLNQEMQDKTARGVEQNDPALFLLQAANAAYHDNPTPENLDAYNEAYSAWWQDHAHWMALPQNQKPVPPKPPQATAPWKRFGLLPWLNKRY